MAQSVGLDLQLYIQANLFNPIIFTNVFIIMGHLCGPHSLVAGNNAIPNRLLGDPHCLMDGDSAATGRPESTHTLGNM